MGPRLTKEMKVCRTFAGGAAGLLQGWRWLLGKKGAAVIVSGVMNLEAGVGLGVGMGLEAGMVRC